MKNVHVNFNESLAQMLPHSIYNITYSDSTNETTVVVPSTSLYEVILFLRDHQNGQFRV